MTGECSIVVHISNNNQCLRYLAWIEGERNSTQIKVIELTTGETSVLENLQDEPLDIDIDAITGALYWTTVNGKLQSFSNTKIETIYEFDDLIPTSLTIFEVYAYVVIQRNIIRINLLKPEGTYLYVHVCMSYELDYIVVPDYNL